jgi:hypothetical protein
MFIEVTNKATGNKAILPRLSTFVHTESAEEGRIVTVGTLGGDTYFDVSESYEEVKSLLGLVRILKEVTNGN